MPEARWTQQSQAGRLLPVFLSIYNDVIVRTAMRAGLPVIDLREVCTESGDFAHEIEPSVSGGVKVAQAICSGIG
jgi:hypothetical protein